MSTIIQIKRNSGTTAPTTSDLVIGEMAYAYDASNDGAGAKLYIEATKNASANGPEPRNIAINISLI